MDKEKAKKKAKHRLRNEVDQDNRKDVTVYNVPDEVWSEFVSFAKLHYDNEGWKVLRDGLASLLDDKTSRVDELEARVERVEEKIGKLAMIVQELQSGNSEEDAPEPPKTMGGD